MFLISSFIVYFIFRGNLVRQGQLEIEAIRVHQDHQVSMVYQELLERRGPR